jgi:hypothetical protein
MLLTKICEMFGFEGAVALPLLVAAVSEAGGLDTIALVGPEGISQ